MRKAAVREGRDTRYDRHCLNLDAEEVTARLKAAEPHTVRLKVPPGVTVVEDLVYGTIECQHSQIDDQVLLKSDGFPTYHLASVVDDHLMRISHVIRGEEWLSSTPKHLLLYHMLGCEPPQFAHLPLLLNEDRVKLSKRHGGAAVEEYMGRVPPEALVNFCAMLGWNPGTNQEVFSLEELAQCFDLETVNRGGAVVDRRKLQWFSAQHTRIAAQDQRRLAELTKRLLSGLKPRAEQSPEQPHDLQGRWQDEEYGQQVVQLMAERIEVLDRKSVV